MRRRVASPRLDFLLWVAIIVRPIGLSIHLTIIPNPGERKHVATTPAELPAVPAPASVKPGVNPWAVALTVTLATFMELLDTSIANVSLPHIAGGLGRSFDETTWVLTSYLVANA